jgi:nucleoprotein TPR
LHSHLICAPTDASLQTSDAQATREGLIVAKTSQEHLEQRVADLVNQITAKDEKLAIYEGRRSTSSDSAQTREQELEIMVGDLR